MKKLLLVILLFVSFTSQAQCDWNSRGIMGGYGLRTVIEQPAFEVSIGQGIFYKHLFENLTKVDVNYITKSGFIYGGSFGVVTHNPIKPKLSDNIATNVFLGYNLANCVMIGATFGMTNVTTMRINDNQQPVIYRGWHPNLGMSIKFISQTSFNPITFGGFSSSNGSGLTIGMIF